MTRPKSNWSAGERGHISEHDLLSIHLNAVYFATDFDTLQEAIDAAHSAGGGVVEMPDDVYTLTSSLSLYDNTILRGHGPNTILQVNAGATFALLDCDGVSNVRICDLKLVGTGAGSPSRGITVRGDSNHVFIERVATTGFERGINVQGSAGSTPGTCMQITLRDCECNDAVTQFGIMIADCYDFSILNCSANYNYLDGLKLEVNTLNGRIVGGSYTYNGQSPSDLGDGMDAYYGGDTFILSHVVFDNNLGHGMTIKEDSTLAGYPDATYTRRVLIDNVLARNNQYYGLLLGINPVSDDSVPLISNAVVNGGIFQGNQTGIFIEGRSIVLNAPMILDNAGVGLYIMPNALYVDVIAPIIAGNSHSSPGTTDNVNIGGQHIRFLGGILMGVELNTAKVESDLAAATKYARRNINVIESASDVIIRDVMEAYSSLSPGIIVLTGSGVILTNQKGSFNPTSSPGSYGSIGSIFINEMPGAATDVMWLKVSGNRDAPTTGWQKVVTSA